MATAVPYLECMRETGAAVPAGDVACLNITNNGRALDVSIGVRLVP